MKMRRLGICLALATAFAMLAASAAVGEESYRRRARKPPRHPALAMPGECAQPRSDSLQTPPVSAGPSTGDPTSFAISGVPGAHMIPDDVGAGSGGPGTPMPGPGTPGLPGRGPCEAASCVATTPSIPAIVEPPVVPVKPPGVP